MSSEASSCDIVMCVAAMKQRICMLGHITPGGPKSTINVNGPKPLVGNSDPGPKPLVTKLMAVTVCFYD